MQAQHDPASAPKPAPDVLVFTNGDQLTGHLERASAGNVVFKSDMAGEITVSLSKVKEIHSATKFAVLRKGPPGKDNFVAEGDIHIADGTIAVTSAQPPVTLATKDLGYLVDTPTYDKQVGHHIGFTHGWNGTVTGGATLVRSTQTSTTLTAGIALVRATPSVAFLPPHDRTTFNLTETYGKQTSPVIPPPPADSDLPTSTQVVSSIFHADAEQDRYFTPTLYALGDLSFDHNFSQGLQLQQVYGGGIGWTPIKTAKQELDLKGDVHYEKQQYLSTDPAVSPSPAVNLFGSTFTENYTRSLPRKLVFTESGNYLPAWTESRAYSANVTATLAIPVYKRLSASISTTDNYLNDPEPYYNRNSYQFVTGVSYTLH
jgi:hypothetical protein